MDDTELQELFTDPADREVIKLLQSSRPSAPPLDPHFRNYLRAKLMTEARNTLAAPSRRRWYQLGPAGMVPAMAAVAAGFILVLGIQIYLRQQSVQTSPVAANIQAIDHAKNVATAEPIHIPFSGPVDKTAVEESVVLQPATAVTTRWEGQTLVITPAHPLAPNTTYKVTLQPKAVPPPASPAASAPAQRPVVVHFLTAPAPVPPVVPPSFRSGSVSWKNDERIPDSSNLSSPTWTPDGQLLVTRPAAPASPAASTTTSASPSASPTPLGPTGTTDIWLMNTQGTLLRKVAPNGSYAAAAPSGGLFADWQEISADHSTLEIRDLQGTVQTSSVATISGRPVRPAVWLGSNRLAYVADGTLRIVDVHGTVIAGPTLKVGGPMAASRTGQLLAVKLDTGSVVLDLTAMTTTPLPAGATGFAWSPTGQLAFTVPEAAGTVLYAGADASSAKKIAVSKSGETWSDLNWAPDSTSLLFASHLGSGNSQQVRLRLVNADGTAPATFGTNQLDYASPLWSPQGDRVLFARRDEAGGMALWTAKAAVGQRSAADEAESQALAEVDKFMQARIKGDVATAQAQLDPQAQQAYANGASSLLSPGAQFSRYYPVTVQLAGPNRFTVGARIFIARGNTEISFFEEQLTVMLRDQRYLIDAVTATSTVALGHGPTVVSVEVRRSGANQQVMVRFDADLKPESLSANTILIKDGQGNTATAQVSFDPDAHLVTVEARLRPGTYTLVVTTGVADINGTPVAQTYNSPLVIGAGS
ncbi:MAG: Ig-like domain-containing protein [Candidatus Dormibacteraeota bacterium]|nr:Ig-like domain-containing protein [Candidatus Dormibacteraeota bacterium]